MKYIGIDSCKGGWLCVGLNSLDSDDWQMDFIAQLTEISVAIKRSEQVLINMPIGMRSINCKDRLCDIEARKILAPSMSSTVIAVPCRKALKIDTYTEASAMNYACAGRTLNRQTWNMMPKIREVDLYIRRRQGMGKKIREIHPEIVFWSLNGKIPMKYPWNTEEGIVERIAVLKPYFSYTSELADSIFQSTNYGQGLVVKADVLGAIAAAVTATFKGSLKTIPKQPETDTRNLSKELVYPGLE
ncbi:DUF429 domain-containing protein [bacterium]|nr:DUF429 domain-containing protein [bacterium]